MPIFKFSSLLPTLAGMVKLAADIVKLGLVKNTHCLTLRTVTPRTDDIIVTWNFLVIYFIAQNPLHHLQVWLN